MARTVVREPHEDHLTAPRDASTSRPHWLEDRVRGHVLICMQALFEVVAGPLARRKAVDRLIEPIRVAALVFPASNLKYSLPCGETALRCRRSR